MINCRIKSLWAILCFVGVITICFFGCGESDDDDSSAFPVTDDDDDVVSDDDDISDDDVTDDDDDTVDDDDDATDDDVVDDDDDTTSECTAEDWPFNPPEQPGPYEVGVTTLAYVDESRFELWGLRHRIIPLEIWYPSNGQGGTINTMADMIGEVPDWGWDVFDYYWGESFDELWNTETSALREAELLDMPCPYPVILFSHGLTAVRFQNFTLAEHLASHGFIVVAPDHYGNAVFLNDPDAQVIIFNPTTFVTSFFDRVKDFQFVYDRLLELNADQTNRFYGALDLEHFGLTGHSYGGISSLAAGPVLDFVDAIAPLNPPWIAHKYPEDFAKPFFFLNSTIDRVVGDYTDEAFTAFKTAISEKKIYINLKRGGHYSATDACLLLPPGYISPSSTGCGHPSFIDGELANRISYSYMTAFFRSALLEDARYDYFLRVNHQPGEIDFISTWGDNSMGQISVP